MQKYLPPHPFDKDAHPFSSTAYTPSAPYIYTPKIKKKSDKVDTSDPTQMNSMADLISKTVFSDDLGKSVTELPAEIFKLWKRLTFDPIAKGFKSGYVWPGFKDALFNNLNAMGEDVDYVTQANLVKALVFDKDGLNSIAKATGWGGGKRKQFDAANYIKTPTAGTDFLASLGAEVVMDPTFWLTLGISGIAKTGTSALKSTLKTVIKETATDLGDDVAEGIAKAAAHRVVKGADVESALRAGYNTVKDKSGMFGFFEKIPSMGLKAAVKYNDIPGVGLTTIKSLNKMVDGINTVGSLPIKAMWNSTPIPWAYRGIKWYRGSSKFTDTILTKTVAAKLEQFPGLTIQDYVNYVRPEVQLSVSKFVEKDINAAASADKVATYIITSRLEDPFIDSVKRGIIDNLSEFEKPQVVGARPKADIPDPVQAFDNMFQEHFHTTFNDYVSISEGLDVGVIRSHIQHLEDYRSLLVRHVEYSKVKTFGDDFQKTSNAVEDFDRVLKNITEKRSAKVTTPLTITASENLINDLDLARDFETERLRTLQLERDILTEKAVLEGYSKNPKYTKYVGKQLDKIRLLELQIPVPPHGYEEVRLRLNNIPYMSDEFYDAQLKNLSDARNLYNTHIDETINLPVEEFNRGATGVLTFIRDTLVKEQDGKLIIPESARPRFDALTRLFTDMVNLNITPDMLYAGNATVKAQIMDVLKTHITDWSISKMYVMSQNVAKYADTEDIKYFLALKEFTAEMSNGLKNIEEFKKLAVKEKGLESLFDGLEMFDKFNLSQKFNFLDYAPESDEYKVLKAESETQSEAAGEIIGQLSQYKEVMKKIFQKRLADNPEFNTKELNEFVEERGSDIEISFPDNVEYTDIIMQKFDDLLEFLADKKRINDPLEWITLRNELSEVMVTVKGTEGFTEVVEDGVAKTLTTPAKDGFVVIDVFDDVAHTLKEWSEDAVNWGDLEQLIDLHAWADEAEKTIDLIAKEKGVLNAEMIYKAQASKHMVANAIIQDDRIIEFVKQFSDPGSDIADAFKQIYDAVDNVMDNSMSAGRDVLNSFKSAVRRHSLVAELFFKMKNTPELKQFYNIITDSLLTNASSSIDFALSSRSGYFRNLFSDIRRQSVSKGQIRRENLEDIAKRSIRGKSKKSLNDWLVSEGVAHLGAHEGRYDIAVTKWLLDHRPKWFDAETLELYRKGELVIWDIETTDLNSTFGQVYQIAFYDRDSIMKSFTSKDFEKGVMSPTLYPKMYGGSPDALAAHVADTTAHTIVHDNELALLESFLQTLLEGRNANELPKLFGWNTAEFDSQFISDRLKNFRDASSRKSLQTDFDTLIQKDGYLEVLNNVDKIPVLHADQVASIRRYVNTYLDQRSDDMTLFQMSSKATPLYDTFTKDTIRALSRFIQDDLGKTRLVFADNDIVLQSKNVVSDYLRSVHEAFTDILISVSTINKVDLRGAFVVKNSKGELTDFVGRKLSPGGKALHVMQLVHSGKFEDPFLYGMKKVFDKPLISTYLGLAKNDLEFSQNTRILSFAKRADKLRESVMHVQLPIDYAPEITKAMELTKQWLKNRPIENQIRYLSYAEHIDPQGFKQAMLTSYITMQTMVQDLVRKSAAYKPALLGFLKDNGINIDLLKLLNDPARVFGFDISHERLWNDRFFDLNLQDDAKLLDSFFKEDADGILGTLSENIALLKQYKASLGTVLERSKFDNVLVRMQVAVVDKAIRAWEPIKQFVKTAQPEEIAALKNKLMTYADLNYTTELVYLKNLTPEQLAENLFLHRQSLFTFDSTIGGNPVYRGIAEQMTKLFKDNAAEYAKHGIEVEERGGRLWVGLNNSREKMQWWKNLVPKQTEEELSRYTTNASRNKAILDRGQALLKAQEEYLKLHPIYNEEFTMSLHQSVVDIFDGQSSFVQDILHNMQDLMAQVTHGSSIGASGELYGKAEHLKVMHDFAPYSFRKILEDTDDLIFPNINFNKSILGGLDSRQDIMKHISGNIIKNYFNAVSSVVHVLETRTKLLQMFYDDRILSPDGPLFESFSAKELYDNILVSKDYVLTGIVADHAPIVGSVNTSGIVKAFEVHSAEQLDQILNHSKNVDDLHLQIMPIHQYLYAVEKINDFKITTTSVKVLNEYIMGPTKTGYLTSLGFIFRNIVDTGLKNGILAGFGEQKNLLRCTLESAKLYNRYTEILKLVQKYDDGIIKNKTGSFSNRVLDRLYTTNKELSKTMTKEMFHMINDFVQQGPSAGISTVQKLKIAETIAEKRKESGAKKMAYEYIMGNPATTLVMNANTWVEQIYRLSAYMWELQHGANNTEAMGAVLKYHFDYTPKTRLQYYIDYAVPFAAFTQNNMLFWMDMLEHPGYFGRLFVDYTRANWDIEDRRNMQYNLALQYHMTSGNLMLGNFAVKLNLSALDVVQTLTNPNELFSKLAFYLKVPIEVLSEIAQEKDTDIRWTLLSTIPILGAAMQKYGKSVPKAFKAADLPIEQLLVMLVPSIFTAIADKEWHKQLYYKKLFIKRGKRYMPKHKKAKRVYPRKTFAPKSYMKKQYLDRIMQNPARKIMRIASSNAIKKGTTGLKAKMIPTSYLEYKKRLRANWKYIRNS
jgi:hypothetical protein